MMLTREIDGVEFVRFADPDELASWIIAAGWQSVEELESILGRPVVGSLLHRWIRAYRDERNRLCLGIKFVNSVRAGG